MLRGLRVLLPSFPSIVAHEAQKTRRLLRLALLRCLNPGISPWPSSSPPKSTSSPNASSSASNSASSTSSGTS
ncbi:hypothetical protein KC315_g51 [Hortaea werneckii]|nr:hypothetical protein KC315_g51 [Hortaea werneckii]